MTSAAAQVYELGSKPCWEVGVDRPGGAVGPDVRGSPPAEGTSQGPTCQDPGVHGTHRTPPREDSPASPAPPLTCSVHPLSAPGPRGLGHGWSGIRSRSNLGSRSGGRPAELLLHRGGGVEP